jgi:hypothetical protein
MAKKKPTRTQIEIMNAFFAKPFPLDYDIWSEEDHKGLREAIEVAKNETAYVRFPLLGVTCMFMRSFKGLADDFEAMGWIWDKTAEEWIPPLEQ